MLKNLCAANVVNFLGRSIGLFVCAGKRQLKWALSISAATESDYHKINKKELSISSTFKYFLYWISFLCMFVHLIAIARIAFDIIGIR